MQREAIQKALADLNLDGWLFYDFRGSDPLAARVLGLSQDKILSRRWFYFVPAKGEPVKIVHAIESGALDALPGVRKIYLPWQQLEQLLRDTLSRHRTIAMQYSPANAIPYVSRVDAGTLELIRSFGVDVVSSADLVQQFEATIDDAQYASHEAAADPLFQAVADAFDEISRRLRAGQETTEYDIQQFIWNRFADAGLTADHAPIVAVEEHSADPHYVPTANSTSPITTETFVLIDAWCKLKKPGSIYADITWVGYTGQQIPKEYLKIFGIVKEARDTAIRFVQETLAAGGTLRGCDVDDACRAVIHKAGYGEFFIHRTGHSIHENDHGNGANLDNLETRDERRLIPRTLFSIEPGIYLPGKFGVRSEVNMFLPDERTAIVTGRTPQQEILKLL